MTIVATNTPGPVPPPCPDQALDQLRMSIRGEVLTPEEPGYATVPVPFNAMYPGRPAIVVRAAGIADVIDAVRFAREHGLLMAIRGGGHSVAGLSSIDGGLLLELTLMNGVDVDPDRGVVRVQGGARWADVDRDTQAFGLVAPGGIVSDTGVAGLTLGGGEGWVRRKYGLSCDNLVEAQVVVRRRPGANGFGRHQPGSRSGRYAEGAGTSESSLRFTFRLSKLGPEVAFAAAFYPIDAAAQVLRGYRDFMAKAPDEVTALALSTTLPRERAHAARDPRHAVHCHERRLRRQRRERPEGHAAAAGARDAVGRHLRARSPLSASSRPSTSSSGAECSAATGSPPT